MANWGRMVAGVVIGVAGTLYSRSVPALVGVVALTQAVAAVLLVRSLRVRSA